MANFDAEANKWIRTRNETINRLHQLADKLDQMQKRFNISNIVGSSVSIATGIGSIVCFGLAVVTAGISIIPGIVLAAVGGGGGLTSAGAFFGKHFHEKHLLKNVQTALDNDRRQSERLNAAVAKLEKTTTGMKGGKLAKGGIGGANVIAGIIDIGAGSIANIVKGGAKATARTVSQVAGTVVFALDLVLLPLDIYLLVDTSIDVHRGSIHEAAVNVRNVAAKLEEERNTFQELFNGD